MKMTREESIRNFREHWASLAITGTDDKRDYLRRHGFQYISCACFLCEYVTDGMGRDCNKCPVEWPVTNTDMDYKCERSFYGDWERAESPEERKRLAAIIRDLPEKQEVKLKPKFSVGDKVYPVSKTVPGFENNIKEDVHWQKSEPRGYFFVTDIDEYKTKSTGKTVYVCKFRKNATTGNCFFESDLRPYVEPEERKFAVGDIVTGNAESDGKYTVTTSNMTKGEVVGILSNGSITIKILEHADFKDVNGIYLVHEKHFELVTEELKKTEYPKELQVEWVGGQPKLKVGDRVRVIKEDTWYGTNAKGKIGIISSVDSQEHPAIKFNPPLRDRNSGREMYWGDKEFGLPAEILELLPINHCPEPKTITENGATFVFRDNVTVCIIDAGGRKFKGIAKCAPEDDWNEVMGKAWAYLRAMRKLLNNLEAELKHQ